MNNSVGKKYFFFFFVFLTLLFVACQAEDGVTGQAVAKKLTPIKVLSCSESGDPNGDPYTSGTVLASAKVGKKMSNRSFTDKCVKGKGYNLIEYVCDAANPSKVVLNQTAHFCEANCSQGACIIPPEACGDGSDNDLDGLVDCADVDSCAGELSCQTNDVCVDGDNSFIDLNGDGNHDSITELQKASLFVRANTSGISSETEDTGAFDKKEDICVNEKKVREYFCQDPAGARLNSKAFDCPEGSTCVDGACSWSTPLQNLSQNVTTPLQNLSQNVTTLAMVESISVEASSQNGSVIKVRFMSAGSVEAVLYCGQKTNGKNLLLTNMTVVDAGSTQYYYFGTSQMANCTLEDTFTINVNGKSQYCWNQQINQSCSDPPLQNVIKINAKNSCTGTIVTSYVDCAKNVSVLNDKPYNCYQSSSTYAYCVPICTPGEKVVSCSQYQGSSSIQAYEKTCTSTSGGNQWNGWQQMNGCPNGGTCTFKKTDEWGNKEGVCTGGTAISPSGCSTFTASGNNFTVVKYMDGSNKTYMDYCFGNTAIQYWCNPQYSENGPIAKSVLGNYTIPCGVGMSCVKGMCVQNTTSQNTTSTVPAVVSGLAISPAGDGKSVMLTASTSSPGYVDFSVSCYANGYDSSWKIKYAPVATVNTPPYTIKFDSAGGCKASDSSWTDAFVNNFKANAFVSQEYPCKSVSYGTPSCEGTVAKNPLKNKCTDVVNENAFDCTKNVTFEGFSLGCNITSKGAAICEPLCVLGQVKTSCSQSSYNTWHATETCKIDPVTGLRAWVAENIKVEKCPSGNCVIKVPAKESWESSVGVCE